MGFWQRLRTGILRRLAPELFSGAPQPHENDSLADGPAIVEARKNALLEVRQQSMTAQLDGDRALLEFSQGAKLWIDADGADSLAHLLVHIAQQIRANRGEMQLQTSGERAEDAIDIKKYSFLVHTSKGMYRFDKELPGAFINPGQDVAYATVQFTMTPDGQVICDDGWERAL